MTDPELDTLVEMLQQRNKSKHGYSGHPLYNRDGLQAAGAITTLRAQLAAARAERDYDRRQSEHKSVVIDKLNAMLTRSQRSLVEAIAEAHACGAEREAWKDRAALAAMKEG